MNRPDYRPAVEDLYRAFQNVRKPTGIDFCAHCHDPGEVADLLSKPLRDVSIESLTSYIYSAFNTGGAKEDYMYFLPRCLDLCCSSGYPRLDVELVLNKLPQAEWRIWPEQLQRGVERFIDQVLTSFVSGESDGLSIDGWFCGAGGCLNDVIPFADNLLTKSSVAENSLIAWYECNSGCLQRGYLCNPFWDHANPNHERLVKWFQSAKVTAWINSIYERRYS
jgi:hypothetical protein